MAHSRFSGLGRVLLLLPVCVFAVVSTVSASPIVKPGAPGEASERISAEDATDLASVAFSEADVRFMQDMVSHHWQAVEMSELAADRSHREDIRELAERILVSQEDEISYMAEWLRERDQSVPSSTDHHGHEHDHHHQGHGMMAGMATPEEMEELADASGNDFDRLFLALMIEHHKGALEMVRTLLRHAGAAQDPVLYEFVNDVSNDQSAEIERMDRLLAGLSPDPRAGLAAGFRDAGEAIENMRLVATVPKPKGFYNPANPMGLSMSRLRELAGEEDENGDADEHEKTENRPDRPSLLSFSNTDMAFDGDRLILGNYHGFKIYDIGGNGDPELVTAVVCPGGQGDVSLVGDLVIMSVEQSRGRLDCGLQGVSGLVNEDRFRGLRIFDISDVDMPRQVGAVQTCRGSHTHTVVSGPEDDGRIIVYNSATSFVRDDEELAGCANDAPHHNEDTALYRIDVIEIPVDDPAQSRIINRPFIFRDDDRGSVAGLWAGGDHGPDTQSSRETNHCHDITVFPDKQIAAGACSGNGILLDISDPVNPVRIDEVVDPGFAYWHSATFSNEGDKVVFTDEWGGGSRARCRASDSMEWGANAVYDIVDGKLEFRSYYKMPAPQSEQENCVAHNGSIVPIPGRDIFAQAWYQGGISLMDFTDTANPVEIAYFSRGPIDEEELVMGGYWSTYWHNGLIYGSEIARGLDVLALEPSEHLSANEIAAASAISDAGVFNPQKQFRIEWKAEAVVARAYLDQLARGDALTDERLAELNQLVDSVEALLEDGGLDRRHARQLKSAARDLRRMAKDTTGITARRLSHLADTLSGMTA